MDKWRDRPEGPVVKRQLDIPSSIYSDADIMMVNENARRNLTSRKEKLFLNDFLIILIRHGISFMTGKVYSPEDKHTLFSKDTKWNKLHKDAEASIQKLRDYEAKLLKAEAS